MRAARWKLALGLAVLAGVGAFLYTLQVNRPHRQPATLVPLATRFSEELGFPPGPVGETVYQTSQGLLWAWDWATQGLERFRPREPVATVHFLGGGEVAVEGEKLVRFRRPLPTDPGLAIPPALVEEHLRRKLSPVIPEFYAFSLRRLASRVDAGITWHRAHWVLRGEPLPPGWQEELEVEVAGSTVVALSRRLIPDPDPMGVVVGRVAELQRARWLAFFAAALSVLGLFVATAEAFWFRLRLPWLSAFVLAIGCWALGRSTAHSLPVSGFWAVSVFFSVLVLGGLAPRASGGRRAYAVLGLFLASWSLLWPELVRAAGGWLPRTGTVLNEPWPLVLAEAGFRALGEEPLLRGGIPWLLRPFLGPGAAYVLAAAVGSLLHPLPAVPLPAGVLGELSAQSVLGWLAWRYGWGWAVGSRLVWELVRLGYFAPQFPWGEAWNLLFLWAFGSLLWPGKGR